MSANQLQNLSIAFPAPKRGEGNGKMIAVLDRVVVLRVLNDLVSVRLELRNLIFEALVFTTAALVIVMDD